MSIQKARRLLFEIFDAASGTPFVGVCLDAPGGWARAHTVDLHGRPIYLLGTTFASRDEAGKAVVAMVLEQLRTGLTPECVPVFFLTPAAAAAFMAIVDDGVIDDFLVHGARGGGKSVGMFLATLALAERHYEAGYESVFVGMLLHDSLKSADDKSGQTFELALWQGIWTLEADRTRAVCRLQGREFMKFNFVGCADHVSAERLRQSTNFVMTEDVIGGLSDGVGITEDQYLIARSSLLRLETARRVSVALTNPGATTTWPYRYWGLGGAPLLNRCAIQIPREDRLTVEQQAQLDATFASNPILQRRLARGEWVGVIHGATVAEGFDEGIHVARHPLSPNPAYLLAIGWDGGHSPSAVIGQNINGQIQIFAALNGMRIGVLELIEREVKPWLQSCAAWALTEYGARVVHVCDPNMATPGQATIHESAERMIQEHLGGRIIHGAVRWPPRREAVLRVLAPRHEQGRAPLQIAPGSDTELLVQAFSGQWYYPIGSDGQVDRSGPKKPNSPFADVGDAAAYLFGWLLGGELMEVSHREMKVAGIFSNEQMQQFGGPIHVDTIFP